MSYGNFSLNDMTREVARINVEKGWRTGENTFGDYIALLHSELSEALEAYRDHRLLDATDAFCGDHSGICDCAPPKPEGVGSELADVLIRLLDTCDVYGIDLAAEFWRKLAYNRTRPYQHGGRTLNGATEAAPIDDTPIAVVEEIVADALRQHEENTPHLHPDGSQ